MTGRLLAVALTLAACAPSPHGIAGSWTAHAAAGRGHTAEIGFQFATHDSILTGTVSGLPSGAPATVDSGKVRVDSLWFFVEIPDDRGTSRRFAFTGRLVGNSLTGAIAGPDGGQRFTFTATRSTTALAHGAGGSGERVRAAGPARGTVGPPHLTGRDPTPVAAIPATLAAFDHHEIVGLGILSYSNQDFDQFILDLIRDPAFPARVNDIAIECGNARYQDILDRYVAGDPVPLSAVRPVWRNTTQPFCGVTTFYEQLVPLVRRINARLPVGHRLRVLACDPAIDWPRARTRTDLKAYGDRDSSITSVMMREVLEKHRKALMIFGVRHLLHGGWVLDSATYVIMAHNGFGNGTPLARYNDELERRLAAWPVPSIAPLAGTWLDDLPYAYFFPGEARPTPISSVVDAYLYLGPGSLLLNQPIPGEAVLDTAYIAELERRARLRGGEMGLDRILREAARDQVFFNDSVP
ncbi:MAG: hypothetical protein ACREL4_03890 [Gemmatimonadales bacterium]